MKHVRLVLLARRESAVPPSYGRDQCVHLVHRDSVQAQTSLETRPWMNKRLNEILRRCAVLRVSSQHTSREQYRRIPTRAPPGEEDMDDINLEDEEGEESTARQMAQRALQRSQQAARQAATQARNAARSFARNLSQRLGSGYQRVPTSEVELEDQWAAESSGEPFAGSHQPAGIVFSAGHHSSWEPCATSLLPAKSRRVQRPSPPL